MDHAVGVHIGSPGLLCITRGLHRLDLSVYFHAAFIIVIPFFLWRHPFCYAIMVFSYFVDVFNGKICAYIQLFHNYSSLSNNAEGLIISIGLYPFRFVIALTPRMVLIFTMCLKFHDNIQSQPYITAAAMCWQSS